MSFVLFLSYFFNTANSGCNVILCCNREAKKQCFYRSNFFQSRISQAVKLAFVLELSACTIAIKFPIQWETVSLSRAGEQVF